MVHSNIVNEMLSTECNPVVMPAKEPALVNRALPLQDAKLTMHNHNCLMSFLFSPVALRIAASGFPMVKHRRRVKKDSFGDETATANLSFTSK